MVHERVVRDRMLEMMRELNPKGVLMELVPGQKILVKVGSKVKDLRQVNPPGELEELVDDFFKGKAMLTWVKKRGHFRFVYKHRVMCDGRRIWALSG